MTEDIRPVFIIDDDTIMAECCVRAINTSSVASSLRPVIFSDVISAIQALDDSNLPAMIFLDILLNGPDGFTFLNELCSYSDTARIPVVIVTSLELSRSDLTHYGVVKVLIKDSMTPADISSITEEYCHAP